jgi:hypothetical protein
MSKQTDALKAAALARLAKASSSLTDADREEIAERAEIAALVEKAKEEERKARNLDLDRRLQEAQERLGTSEGVEALAIEEFPDTFIVKRNSKAHARWNESVNKLAGPNGKGDRAKIYRDYAACVVDDWNGVVLGESDSEMGAKLIKYLVDNPGIVTPLTDCAARLAGVFAEDRKS